MAIKPKGPALPLRQLDPVAPPSLCSSPQGVLAGLKCPKQAASGPPQLLFHWPGYHNITGSLSPSIQSLLKCYLREAFSTPQLTQPLSHYHSSP